MLKNEPDWGIFAQTTHSHQALHEAPSSNKHRTATASLTERRNDCLRRTPRLCVSSEDLEKDEGESRRSYFCRKRSERQTPVPLSPPAHYLTKRTHTPKTLSSESRSSAFLSTRRAGMHCTPNTSALTNAAWACLCLKVDRRLAAPGY